MTDSNQPSLRRDAALYFFLFTFLFLVSGAPYLAAFYFAPLVAPHFFPEIGILRTLGFPLFSAVLAFVLYSRLRRAPGAALPWWVRAALVIIFAWCAFLIFRADFAFVRLGSALLLLTLLLSGLRIRFRPAGSGRDTPGTRLPQILRYVLVCLLLAVSVVEAQLLVQYFRAYAPRDPAIRDFPGTFDPRAATVGLMISGLDAPLLLGNGQVGRIHVNRAGFRADHELLLPKPPDEFRIVLLGDSFSLGYRTDQTRTLAHLLERDLARRSNRKVRVYVARAMESHSFLLWLLQHADAVQADLFLNGITIGNDLPVIYIMREQLRTGDRGTPLDSYARNLGTIHFPASVLDDVKNSFVDNPFDVVQAGRGLRRKLRVATLLELRRPTPVFNFKTSGPGRVLQWDQQNDLGLYLKEADPSATAIYAATDRTFSELGALPLRERLRFFVYPQRFQQSAAEWAATVRWFGLRADAFDLEKPNRELAQMCARYNLRCHDLLPAFRARGDELLHYPYDMHWNDAGNAVAAEAITEILARDPALQSAP